MTSPILSPPRKEHESNSLPHHGSRTGLKHMSTHSHGLPKYSKEQLQAYFRRIKLPQKYLDSPVLSDRKAAKTEEHGLPFIKALTRYHLCNVPFENLELHYSKHKSISLDMDDLLIKFVERGLQYGRGGRCMENNGFFGTVLRSLGFDVRNCAGRVSRMMSPDHDTREKQGDTYDGWNHMLNLVRLDGHWFVVDVGMGAMGPQIPYPLKDGFEMESIPPRKLRLQLRSIPEHAAEHEHDAQKLWCFDVCHDPKSEGEDKWIPTYCFTETEFLPQDYEMMSWFTSTHKRSFFTYAVLCTKMLQDEHRKEIIGDVSLYINVVRKTIGGKRTTVKECKNERDRVDALAEFFDVRLTDEEIESIHSNVVLKGNN